MLHSEIGDDGQMIGRNQRRSAAVEFGFDQFQGFVKVNMIQMQEW